MEKSGSLAKNGLRCSICKNFIREPRVLDCLHSCCLICLRKSQQKEPPNVMKLACPSCDQETLVRDIDELPHFFTLAALVEEAEILQQLQAEGQGSEVICQACDEGNAAVSRCMECDNFLCRECQSAHARLSMIRSHKICPLDKLRSGEVVYRSKLREQIPKCGRHPYQNITLYCTTCQQLLCIICSVQDHSGSKHSLTDLPRASKQCKQNVAEKVSAAEVIRGRYCDAADAKGGPLKKLQAKFDEVARFISRKADEKVARIRQEEQKLKQELEATYQDRIKVIKSAQVTNTKEATKIEHKLEQVKQVTTHANSYDLLNLSQRLLQNLNQLETAIEQPVKAPEKLYYVDFEEHESSLGQLILRGEQSSESKDKDEKLLQTKPLLAKREWKPKTHIKRFGSGQTKFKCAYDVALFSTHEIVIVDIKLQRLILNKSLNTPLPSPLLSQTILTQYLTDPSHVSVNKKDQLIVIDGSEVKIFSKNFEVLKVFVSGEGSESKPTCLSVADNNQIAVGFKYEERICLHEPDGTLIATLRAQMIGEHLATYKKQFIYTNHKHKMLCAVDYNGDSVFSVNITSNIKNDWGPTGVCCDHDGSIYVALNGWSCSELQQFSPQGKFVRRIFDGCGFPWGMKLTPVCDNLVVAANNCVAVFNLVLAQDVSNQER